MNNPFKGFGDQAKMLQQAHAMQKALQQEEVVIERDGVRVVMRGDQQIKEVEIDGILENRIAGAVNEAVKQTQQLAAKKLLSLTQNG